MERSTVQESPDARRADRQIAGLAGAGSSPDALRLPMSDPRFDIPSTSTLLAFEAVARLGTIARAAEERRTSESAISRHVRALEQAFGVALFERSIRGMTLTATGEEYFLGARSLLVGLHATGHRIRTRRTHLVIGCTLEISGLVLLPVFSRLKRLLGEEVAARIVVYDHDVLPLLVRTGLDIVFEGRTGGHPDPDAVGLLVEEIVPVASPALAERFGAVLSEHPQRWNGVPRLDVGRPDPGWATWETWFEAQGCVSPNAPVETFENYLHVLRAAADGDGIAIGWNGFMTDHVEAGKLVALRGEWLRTELVMYGVPTAAGKRNCASGPCLEALAGLVAELRTPAPVTAVPGIGSGSKSAA